jgi:hypothetical protein
MVQTTEESLSKAAESAREGMGADLFHLARLAPNLHMQQKTPGLRRLRDGEQYCS